MSCPTKAHTRRSRSVVCTLLPSIARDIFARLFMATRVTKALSQLFDQGAASYAQYRPEYPPELYRTILQHAKLASRKTAVDIATGSGQAAKDLAQYFDSVIALDSSEAQLKHAPELAKVTFQQGQAEDTKLDSASVDLLTVAQALHWFDLDKFYPEAKRILKPAGALAIWGYDVPQFEAPAANKLLNELYSKSLGPYWDAKRQHIDNHLRGLEPSSEHFSSVQRVEINMQKTMDLSQLVGYLTSWSAYNTYLSQKLNQPDPLKQFAKDFPGAAKLSSVDQGFRVRFPIFLLVCHNRQ